MGCRLTTFDNPYDPFTQFTEWLLFDNEKGYNTCDIVGRISVIPENATQKEEDEIIESAIDNFIFNDVLNLYKKVRGNEET